MLSVSALTCVLFTLLLPAFPSEPEVHEAYREPGSSVVIPGEELKNTDYYELKFENADTDWVAQYHDGPLLHEKYEERGNFTDNGSFLLKNLTKADSRVYVFCVNGEIRHKMHLRVIDPVDHPVLKWTEQGGENCPIHLECTGSGGNVSFFMDGVRMDDNNITRKGNVLLIQVKKMEYWGTYTCQLRNQVSVKNSSAINVSKPASLLDQIGLHTTVPVLIFKCVLAICCIQAYMEGKTNRRGGSGNTGTGGDSTSSPGHGDILILRDFTIKPQTNRETYSEERAHRGPLSMAVLKVEFSLKILCDVGGFASSFYLYQFGSYWTVSALFFVILCARIMLRRYITKYLWVRILDVTIHVADYGTPVFCVLIFISFVYQYRAFCARGHYISLWMFLSIVIPSVLSLVLFLIFYAYETWSAKTNDSLDNFSLRSLDPGGDSETEATDYVKTPDGGLLAASEPGEEPAERDWSTERSPSSEDDEPRETSPLCPGERDSARAASPRQDPLNGDSATPEDRLDGIIHPGNSRGLGEGSAGDPDHNG